MLQSGTDSWTVWAQLCNDILKSAKQYSYIIFKSVVCA